MSNDEYTSVAKKSSKPCSDFRFVVHVSSLYEPHLHRELENWISFSSFIRSVVLTQQKFSTLALLPGEA